MDVLSKYAKSFSQIKPEGKAPLLVIIKEFAGKPLVLHAAPPPLRPLEPQRRMSILEYNGSGVIAMAGKNCVAIATDRRLGASAQTVSCNFNRVFEMHDKLVLGLSGLASDVQTISEKLAFRMKMYELREERPIRPKTFGQLMSNMLYEKRFGPWFIEPVIAGLDENNEPYLCAMDLIGAPVFTKDFVVAGTCANNLYGTCESLFRKDMEPEELFETISQALLAAVDRDALSGWGACVHIITPNKVIKRELKGRMD
jgi:20S proteasome subunit beta 3